MAEKFYTAHTNGEDARAKLSKASRKIAEAIADTLGPNGWNAALERGDGNEAPTVTKDGATVMHDLLFNDKWEMMMYEMYRDASDHISKHIGDGTTSVVILSDAILQRGMRAYAAGHDIHEVIAGFKDAAAKLLQMIEDNCLYKAATEEVLNAVLTVSSAGDAEITNRLTDIFLEGGDSSMIIVKDGAVSQDTHIFEDGYVIGLGTQNVELFEQEGETPKAIINWENPYVLVMNDHVRDFKDLIPVMEEILLKGETKKLVIVHAKMDEPVIEGIRSNNVSDKNDLEILTVRMPMYAERQVNLLEDFGAYVDTIPTDVINKSISVKDYGLKDLGRVEHMSATRFELKVIGGRGGVRKKANGKTPLQERIEFVEADRDLYTGNVQARNDTNYRLARLKSSICCIYPGARSESEAKRRKGVYEDCIRAVQSAIVEGVIPGGGWPMYLMSLNLTPDQNTSEAYRFGYNKMLEASRVIFKKLSKDIEQPAEFIVKQLEGEENLPKAAYNFATKTAGPAPKVHVLEPFYMTKEVLNQALSIATTILLSDGTITRHSTKWYVPWKEKMQSMQHLRY